MPFKSTGAAVLTVSAVLVLASAAQSAEMKAGGTMNASVTQVQAFPLGAQGQVVLTQLEKGTTKSPGSPLDGATILLSESDVLDQGNGPQTGAITLANDKGSLTNEIHGTIKTVMVDGQPRTSTSGTYNVVTGTGIFAGASGHGTYTASFTSKMDWMGEYNGVLTLPKLEASR